MDPCPDYFAQFWAAYPRRVGKLAAQKAWKKLKPDEALAKKILEALEAQSQAWAASGQEFCFIPHPTTWLNQGRWEDELVPLGSKLKPKAAPRPAVRVLHPVGDEPMEPEPW